MKHVSSIMVRTVLALVGLALLFLALVSVLVVQTLAKEQYKSNVAQQEKNMDSLQLLLDNAFYDYLSLSTEIATLPELRPLALSRENHVAQIEAIELLQTLKAVDSRIVDICLYFRENDFFVSSLAAYSADSFVQSYYSFSKMDSEQVYALFQDAGLLLAQGQSVPVFVPVGTVNARPNNTAVSDSLLLLIPLPQWSKNPYATLGVFVQTEDIRQQLSITAGEGAARIVDDQENVLVAVGESNLPDGFAEDASLHIFRRTSGRFGLTYEAYVKEASLFRMNINATYLSALMLLLTFVALFMSVLFAKWVNRPLRQLLAHIGGSNKLLPNESSYIQQYIQQLNKTIAQNEKYVDELMVRRLLAGKQMEEAELVRCENLLKKDYAHCCVMVVRFGRPAETIPSLTTLVCDHALITVLQEAQLNTMTCIIASDGPEQALLKSIEAVRYAPPLSGADVIAIGPMGDTLLQLRDSMLYAIGRMKEMLYQGRTGVEIAGNESARKIAYPADIMHHLKTALHERDASALRTYCGEICDVLLDPNMSPETGAIVACDLASLFPDLTHHVTSSAQVFCGALRQCVEQLAATFCEPTGLQPGDPAGVRARQDLAATIEQMLEEPDFGISTISEKYGMSDSAFSHMFKRTFGITFILYVNTVKIQRAKTLLIETNLSLDAVALRLGYSSASNFTRMFKKHEGITPGTYRQLSRGDGAPGL